MIYPRTTCHTHSTIGSKVKPSNRKLQKFFGLPPYCYFFTFCKNITPPTVMYFYKVYYQNLKVNGASVTSRQFAMLLTCVIGQEKSRRYYVL